MSPAPLRPLPAPTVGDDHVGFSEPVALSGQFDVFPRCAVLHRVDPEQNMQRFYAMRVEPDLLGGAALLIEYGRIGQEGRVRRFHFPDEGRALDTLAELAARKVRRGYGAM